MFGRSRKSLSGGLWECSLSGIKIAVPAQHRLYEL